MFEISLILQGLLPTKKISEKFYCELDTEKLKYLHKEQVKYAKNR